MGQAKISQLLELGIMQQTAETILNAITIINPGNRGLVMAHRKVLETALLELSPGAQELFRTLLDEHLKQVQGTQISDDEQRTEASESTSSTLIEIHDPDEYSIDNPPDVDTILNTLYKLAVNGDNIAGQMLNVLNSNISQQNLQPITERAVKINTTALLNAEYRLLLLLGLYDKKIESPINTDDVEKFIKNHEYGHLVINDKNQTYNLLKQLEGWGIERTETSRRRLYTLHPSFTDNHAKLVRLMLMQVQSVNRTKLPNLTQEQSQNPS